MSPLMTAKPTAGGGGGGAHGRDDFDFDDDDDDDDAGEVKSAQVEKRRKIRREAHARVLCVEVISEVGGHLRIFTEHNFPLCCFL